MAVISLCGYRIISLGSSWKWYNNIFLALMDGVPRVGFSVVMSFSPSFRSAISLLIARVLGHFCFSQIFLQKLFCLPLLGFVLHLKHHTMSNQRGTSHRSTSGRVRLQ